MAKITKETLDALFEGVENPQELLGPDGLFAQLKKAAMERILAGELTHHLGYEKHDPVGNNSGNSRNGHTYKRVLTDEGPIELEVPRDRNGTFEPRLVRKHQRRLPGFDDKVLSLYARGMSVREIQGHLEELYGTEVSPDLISSVTDAVLEEVSEWQNRRLDPVWPIVYLDALVLKIRDNGTVQNKAVYIALGINAQGRKEVLGLWVAQTEGAKFWLHVLTELKNRGVDDILVLCCDGLKGFPEAIEAVYPLTTVQTCIVHMVRNSLRLVAWRNYKAIATDLRLIYTADTVSEAEAALKAFERSWDNQYPSISKSWRSNWNRVTPFFAFTKDIRRVVYTTNAVEALNRQLRKVLKTRGSFPTDEAATKLIWLALGKASQKWTLPIPNWDLAIQQFAIHFSGRIDPSIYGGVVR
jgi:putative transposase